MISVEIWSELTVLLTTVVLAFGVYTSLPYIFYYCHRIRNRFLYAGVINLPHPRFYHLKEPLQFGVENATNHTISISHKDQKDHKINLWDISSNAIETDGGGVDRSCVILYCHGNSCNRAKSHRVELYKVLQRSGHDVVCFDYRGFGDSTGCRPDETSVVEDAAAALAWTIEHYPDRDIVLWGHSLGSGISVKLLSAPHHSSVKGLVLESPFLNSGEAGRHFPISKLFNYFFFTRGVIGAALEGLFPTDELITTLTIPVQIIHAADDSVLPVHNSVELEKICVARGKRDVMLRVVDDGDHKYLYRNSLAMKTALDFIASLKSSLHLNVRS